MTAIIQEVNRSGRNRHPSVAALRRMTAAEPETREVLREITNLLAGENVDHIAPVDGPTVEGFAVVLRQLRAADNYLRAFGLTDRRGRVRGVAQLLPTLAREVRAFAETLGLSPAGRMKLGLDRAKAFDLAAAFAALPEDGEGPGQ
ncbi:MAG: hypothetical protein ACRDF5_10365 [bacterium]